jgi:signal transduction histidine kinase
MEPRVDQQRTRRMVAAAREEERGRWAREIHDDTLQSLAALRVQLSCARRSTDVDELRLALDGAVGELTREIANLRALITELRPAALDELGIEAALGNLFDRWQTTHGVALSAVVELIGGRGRLEPETETAVYRVVQESLTNVARHAAARSVQVFVLERRGEIEITVRDDGRGFDLGMVGPGFGLTGMRERVALVGGHLDVRSSRRGTTVVAVVPAGRGGADPSVLAADFTGAGAGAGLAARQRVAAAA